MLNFCHLRYQNKHCGRAPAAASLSCPFLSSTLLYSSADQRPLLPRCNTHTSALALTGAHKRVEHRPVRTSALTPMNAKNTRAFDDSSSLSTSCGDRCANKRTTIGRPLNQHGCTHDHSFGHRPRIHPLTHSFIHPLSILLVISLFRCRAVTLIQYAADCWRDIAVRIHSSVHQRCCWP
jgi:hypothetical protein